MHIYDEYWQSLYAIGYNRLRSHIIQELFTDLWNKRESLQIKDNLKAYLFTAMKYKVIDYLRRRKLDQVSLKDIQPGLLISRRETEQALSFNELYDSPLNLFFIIPIVTLSFVSIPKAEIVLVPSNE